MSRHDDSGLNGTRVGAYVYRDFAWHLEPVTGYEVAVQWLAVAAECVQRAREAIAQYRAQNLARGEAARAAFDADRELTMAIRDIVSDMTDVRYADAIYRGVVERVKGRAA